MLKYIVSLIVCLNAIAADIPVRWDASPSVDVVGYHLWLGTNSGNYYTNFYVEGRQTTNFVYKDLQAGTYYLMATAINDLSLESIPSNEVVGRVPHPPGNLILQETAVVIGASLEKAEDPAGPWDNVMDYPEWASYTKAGYYRVKMGISYEQNN